MILIFSLLSLLLFSCSKESIIPEDFNIGDVYVESPILSSNFNLYGIDPEYNLEISNIQKDDIVNFYTDKCSTKVSSIKSSGSRLKYTYNLLDDNPYFLSVKVERNSNFSECISINYILDRVVPIINFDQSNNDYFSNNLTLSGSCNKNNTVNFTINETGDTFTTLCQNNYFSVTTSIDSLSEGSFTINAQLDSRSGLTTSESIILIKDSIAPTLSFNSLNRIDKINQNSYTISGICSEASDVSIEVDNITQSTPCTSNTFSSNLSLSSLEDSLLTISASQSDNVNTSTINIYATKDTIAPVLSGLENDTNPVKNKIFEWSCNETCYSRYIIDTNPNTSPTGNWTTNKKVSQSGDGNYYFHIQVKDNYDNESNIFHYSFVLDSSGPNNPIVSLNEYGQSDNFSATISNLSIGEIIYIHDNSSCSSLIHSNNISQTSQVFNMNNLNEGKYNYSVQVEDSSNRLSECVSFSYTRDNSIPEMPILSMQSPTNQSTSKDISPEFIGVSSENGSTIKIFNDPTCSTEIGNTIVNKNSVLVNNINFPLDDSEVGLQIFYGKIIDQALNESNCIDLNLSYTLESTSLAEVPKIALVGNNSPTKTISLQDNNVIKLNGVTLGTYNKGQIVNFNTNQGDKLECSKACYPVTQGFGTAPWASEAYAGKSFTSFITRYGQHNPHIIVAALGKNAFVEVKQNGNVVDSHLIPKNTVHTFNNDLNNNQSFLIESNENIAVYFVSRSSGGSSYNRDARVLTPASDKIIGLSGHVTAIANDTNASYYRTQNSSNNFSLNSNNFYNVGRMRKSDAENWGVYVESDKKVSMTQTADQDGTNATPSIPISMMANNYGIPRRADYVAFISLESGTVDVINPDGSFNKNLTLHNNAVNPKAPYIVYYNDGGTDIPAGTTFSCSVLCMAIYDDSDSGADRDETLMMGF